MRNKILRRIFRHTKHLALNAERTAIDLAALIGEIGPQQADPGSAGAGLASAMKVITPPPVDATPIGTGSASAAETNATAGNSAIEHIVRSLTEPARESNAQAVQDTSADVADLAHSIQEGAPQSTDGGRAGARSTGTSIVITDGRTTQSGQARESITQTASLIQEIVRQTQAPAATSPATRLNEYRALQSQAVSVGQASLSQAQLTGQFSSAANSSANNTVTATSVLPDALNQAVREIEQLRIATINQANMLAGNSQAITQNTAAQSTRSALGSAGNFASSLFGDALSFVPIVSGLLHLFTGGPSQPQPLPTYIPPPSLQFQGVTGNSGAGTAVYNQFGLPREAAAGTPEIIGLNSILHNATTDFQTSVTNFNQSPAASTATPPAGGPSGQQFAPQITVQVQALDSRSFLDRSSDIAQAVREAMLNLHSINDVVNDL